MDDAQLTATFGIILSMLTTLFLAVNHKRCRSGCCGREASISIDVEATTPPRASQHTTNADSS